jgi:mycothiol maleylpyruvate isomerase-like protein
MGVDRSYVEANAGSRERLSRLAERSDVELARVCSNGWTVAALLGHLAFWDAWTAARWDQFEQDGTLEELPEAVQDLVNKANMPQWLALPPARALALACAAAERLDTRLQRLPDEAVAAATDADLMHLLARAEHRCAHLDEIDQTLKPAEKDEPPD